MASSLFRSITSNWFGQSAAILIGLFISPYVVKNLGAQQYGIWALIVSITTQLIILDFGVRHSMVKFVAHYRALGDSQGVSDTSSAALLILLLLAALGLFIVASIIPFFPGWFNIEPQLAEAAKIALLIAAIDGSLEVACGSFNGFLAGSERYDVMNSVNVLRLIVGALFTVLALKAGYGIVGVACAAFAARVIQKSLLAAYIVLREKVPVISLRSVNKERLKEVAVYGFWVCMITLAARIIYHTDALVIGAVLTPSHVTTYAIALLIVEQFRLFSQIGSVVLTPRLSALNAVEDTENSNMLLLKWIRYSQLLSLGLGIPLLVTGAEFLKLWMGAEFAESGIILQILIVPFFMTVPALAFSNYLLALNKHRVAASIQLAEAVINLLLSLLLVTKFGIAGVAVGTVIPALIFSGMMMPLKVSQLCRISLGTYLSHAFLQPMPLAVFQALSLFALKKWIGADSWGAFLLNNCVGFLLFSVVAYYFFFHEEDKAYIKRRLGFGG